MSSKRATYYYRKYNWQEINNLFCYDVKHPERLSKRQQVLRLYKNALRRVWDVEFATTIKTKHLSDYAEEARKVRKEFETLKGNNDEKYFKDILEKYEDYVEKHYQVTPLFRDNVAYEWRHQKGLINYDTETIERDYHGYYSPDKLDYYPKPREFEFRSEPDTTYGDIGANLSENGWNEVNINDYDVNNGKNVKSPSELKEYVDKLKSKLNNKKH